MQLVSSPRRSSGSDGVGSERVDRTDICCCLVFVNVPHGACGNLCAPCRSVTICDTLFRTMLHHAAPCQDVTCRCHSTDFDQGTRVHRLLWHHAAVGAGKPSRQTSQERQPLQCRQESSSLRNQRPNDNKSIKLVQTSSIGNAEQLFQRCPKILSAVCHSVSEDV